MLKIWKQAWKKEDGGGQDSGQDTHSRGPDGDGERQTQSPAVPPVLEHDILGPVAPDAHSDSSLGSKHVRNTHNNDSPQNDEAPDGRPAKRRKIRGTMAEGEVTSTDAISRHLPEMMDVDEPAATLSVDSPEADTYGVAEPLLARAKAENTLAILNSESQKLKVSCELLNWACAMEEDRPHTGIARRRRFAVVVVQDITTASTRAAQLADLSKLSVGAYSPGLHCSPIEHWAELAYKDVVVVAGNFLLESLGGGALAISQIHYMIMDDVTSIKDTEGHPLKQVMLEFYRITDKLSRPKIFGIILPPPNTKFYFDIGLLGVERILDAHIHGVSDAMREAVMTLPDKPMELVVFYDPQVRVIDTALLKYLRSFDPRMSIFRSHFRNAKHALAEVGACASDLVWRRALKEMEAELGADEPVYEEEDELQEGTEIAIRKAKSNIKDAIKDWRFTMPNLDSTSRGFNVTPKFAKLMQILKACEPQGETFRGIVFVQKRSIAYVLTDLLRTLDDYVGFLRPQTIAGHGPSSDPSTQNDILDGFKSGLHNLLVVTKYAEDIDIAPASIVIRFDLFESQISYAHCRTRARGHECHLIHMAERGSDVHRRVLSQVARIDTQMEQWIQHVASNPASAAPPYALRETVDPYRSDSEDEDEDPAKFIKDPTTNGRIYVQDAITVVYRFVSQLQPTEDRGDRLNEPLFEYEELHSDGIARPTYICTVLLPPAALISRISGPPCLSMAQARRHACHQTCIELFRCGMLDYRLFPRPPLPTSRPQRTSYISLKMAEEESDKEDDEAQLPAKAKQGQNKSTGTRLYPRKQPDFWVNSLPIMRGCLYPTIITPIVDPSIDAENGGGLYSPILFLTRLPLPPVASFRLFFSGVAGKVHFTRAAAFEIDDDRLQDLYKYTTRLIRYITNKPLVCALDNMSYFLAPLPYSFKAPFSDGSLEDGHRWNFPNVVDHIPWDRVRLAANRSTVALNTQDLKTLTEDIDDAMIQDRWVEFTRRYFCVRIRADLTPMSKPEDSPREKDFENLLDYCRARRKGFEGLQDDKQPLIEVSRCLTIVNHLNPMSKPIAENKRFPAKYLIPELCAKCTIQASIFRTASLLPSIVRRLDDVLLMKELNAKFFDHSIAEHQLHAAVSSPSAAVEFDYERLELLGDAYLKYLSSIYLFVTFPTLHEGALHIARQRIISNRSLLRNANRCGLPQYIQSKPFTPKVWSPPNFHIYRPPRAKHGEIHDAHPSAPGQAAEDGGVCNGEKGLESDPITQDLEGNEAPDTAAAPAHVQHLPAETKEDREGSSLGDTQSGAKKLRTRKRQKDENHIQWLGDKGVADVAEAIIGAAYVTGGREVALKVTKELNIPVPHIDRWSDFGRKALAPPPEVTAKLRPGSIEAVESIIGHQFNHPHLLAQALTHASIHGNEMTSYERLEFIGDAILDFLVIRHIFDRDSGLSPGALTLLKGAMVSNATLAAVCVWAGLHEHLLFESYSLASSIQAYADELKAKQSAEYLLAAQESRTPGQYWVEVEPPKALSDVVESIMGAVYVSDNFSPIGAETFFDKVLKPFYDHHITLQTLSHHPTKILFELFQSQGCQEFEIVKEVIPPDPNDYTVECHVLVHGIVLASAADISATSAGRRASFFALDAIEGDPDFMTRTCDCRVHSQARKAAKKAKKATSRGIDEVEEKFVEDALDSDADKPVKIVPLEVIP